MNLRDAEIFREVAARRSFSRAAESLGMTQPAVSQSVSNLEKRLGVPLVDRTTRPCGLTAAGAIYRDGCGRLLDGFREVEDRVRGLGGRLCGRLCVTSIFSVGLLQMQEHVRRFGEDWPDVELRLEFGHPDDVYDAVLSDEAELGLVSFPREGGPFACIPWLSEPIVLVAPPGHPLVAGRSVRRAVLSGERFVAFDPPLKIRRMTDRWLKEAGVHPEIVYEFDSLENVKRAVEGGAGIALLPEPSVRREVELGTLETARLSDADWSRPLGIVHRKRRPLSAPAERFIDQLLDRGRSRGRGTVRQPPLAA